MFQITRSVWEEMLSHARSDAPLECCGLLLGSTSLMDELLACTNEHRSPVSFSIPPTQLLDAFRDMRARNLRLLGIYHSHPRGPEHPSTRDIDEFEYPDVSYWVISLNRPTAVVRCFRWVGSGFEEMPFEVTESPRESERPTDQRSTGLENGGLP